MPVKKLSAFGGLNCRGVSHAHCVNEHAIADQISVTVVADAARR
jgi:hypothetical protein